ncbi:hypothetical protein K1719_047345, partial [Acacia pycnantha]
MELRQGRRQLGSLLSTKDCKLCYSCGRLGHEGRSCKNFTERRDGDDKRLGFCSWLSTIGVRTLDEVLEVCRDGWCEAEGVPENASKCSSCQSLSLTKASLPSGKMGPRMPSYQNQEDAGSEIGCHKGIGSCQFYSVEELVNDDQSGQESQTTFNVEQ